MSCVKQECPVDPGCSIFPSRSCNDGSHDEQSTGIFRPSVTGSQLYASFCEISRLQKLKRVVFHRVVVDPGFDALDIIDDSVCLYWVSGSSRWTGLVKQFAELASLIVRNPSPRVVGESGEFVEAYWFPRELSHGVSASKRAEQWCFANGLSGVTDQAP